MSEIPRSKRAIILQYRFVDKLSWIQIASKIGGITADGARMFCKETQKRAKSSNIEDLLKELDPLPRSGRPRGVEPGSIISQWIRESLRGPLRYHRQVEAANITYDRCCEAITKSTTNSRQALRELDAKQVHNIAQGRLHSSLDSIDQRPVTRKRALEKPALSKLNLPDRKRYIDHILSLDDSTILISCDETPIEFGELDIPRRSGIRSTFCKNAMGRRMH